MAGDRKALPDKGESAYVRNADAPVAQDLRLSLMWTDAVSCRERASREDLRPMSTTGLTEPSRGNGPSRASSAATAAIDRSGNKTATPFINRKEKSMKTIQFLKAAGSIACVAFALNATAQTTASAPPATSESVGQHIDDGTVTTKVKAELLGAKNVKSTHIHVKTRKGIVWLTGSVPSAEDKTAAEDVVNQVSGVKGVKNHLKVAAE